MSMETLSDVQKQTIADALEGSSGTYDNAIAEQYGLELEELEAVADGMGVVRCECCGWWVATDETQDGATCLECVEE